LVRLAEAGVVEVVTPFGPNREGTVRLAVYDQLVVLTGQQVTPNGAVAADENRAEYAPEPRPIRALPAPNGAYDQGKRPDARYKAIRQQGSNESPARALCFRCGEPSTYYFNGKPTCDHCSPYTDQEATEAAHDAWVERFENNLGAVVVETVEAEL
jgi:hypothetical protein